MGMIPRDFYEMEVDDFFTGWKGWNKKLLYEQQIAKRMTMIIASAMAGSKNVNPEKLWPLEGDKKKKSKMVEYKGMMITEGQYNNIMARKKKRNG